MNEKNPVSFGEACEFFRRLGYTEEFTWRESHGYAEAKHFQSPEPTLYGGKPQIMIVEWERNNPAEPAVECYAAEHMYFVRPAEPQSIQLRVRAHVRTILAIDKLRRLRGRD